jgi:hypothetical protein
MAKAGSESHAINTPQNADPNAETDEVLEPDADQPTAALSQHIPAADNPRKPGYSRMRVNHNAATDIQDAAL